MTRRNILRIGLSAIAFSLIGCSSNKEVTPKLTSTLLKKSKIKRFKHNLTLDKNYYEALKIYTTFKEKYNFSLSKLEKVGIYKKSSIPGLKHTIMWFYGPNQGLTASDYKLLTFNNDSTLFTGFGLSSQLKIIFKSLFKYEFDIEQRSKEIGFNSFEDLFESTFERLTMSTENDFIGLLFELNNNNIIDWKDMKNYLISEKLYFSFMAPYYYYGGNEKDFIINIDNSKINFDENDTMAYYFTMKIVFNTLLYAKTRSDLYGI